MSLNQTNESQLIILIKKVSHFQEQENWYILTGFYISLASFLHSYRHLGAKIAQKISLCVMVNNNNYNEQVMYGIPIKYYISSFSKLFEHR